MNDDTTPPRIASLVETMNARFDQVDAKLVAAEQRIGRQVDKMEKAADETEQANAMLDRIIAKVTGRALEGRAAEPRTRSRSVTSCCGRTSR